MGDDLWEKIRELEERIKALEKSKTKRRNKETPKEASPVVQIRETFCQSFKEKFGHDYAGQGARLNGLAANWLRSISLEKALGYCKVYPHWKEKFVVKSGHPFELLVKKYIELDAHMQRYPQLISDIIASRARENVEISDKVKDHEQLLNADLHKAQERANFELTQSDKVEIQDNSKPPIPGPCPKLT